MQTLGDPLACLTYRSNIWKFSSSKLVEGLNDYLVLSMNHTFGYTYIINISQQSLLLIFNFLLDHRFFLLHETCLFGEPHDKLKVFSSQGKASKSLTDQRFAPAPEATWNSGATVRTTAARWLNPVPCPGRPFDPNQKAQASGPSPWWGHPLLRQIFRA